MRSRRRKSYYKRQRLWNRGLTNANIPTYTQQKGMVIPRTPNFISQKTKFSYADREKQARELLAGGYIKPDNVPNARRFTTNEIGILEFFGAATAGGYFFRKDDFQRSMDEYITTTYGQIWDPDSRTFNVQYMLDSIQIHVPSQIESHARFNFYWNNEELVAPTFSLWTGDKDISYESDSYHLGITASYGDNRNLNVIGVQTLSTGQPAQENKTGQLIQLLDDHFVLNGSECPLMSTDGPLDIVRSDKAISLHYITEDDELNNIEISITVTAVPYRS